MKKIRILSLLLCLVLLVLHVCMLSACQKPKAHTNNEAASYFYGYSLYNRCLVRYDFNAAGQPLAAVFVDWYTLQPLEILSKPTYDRRYEYDHEGRLVGHEVHGASLTLEFDEAGNPVRGIGFSNNASPAFVISGIGFGLRGSLKTGVFLYFISVISSLTAGLIWALFAKREICVACDYSNSFSFTNSIKSATKATLNICGFICFFSVIIDLLCKIIKSELALAVISSFLEVGNASRFITELNLSYTIKLPLLAFAISYSGISVLFQSKSILSDTDISMKIYYVMKLFSGILSASLTFLSISLFGA